MGLRVVLLVVSVAGCTIPFPLEDPPPCDTSVDEDCDGMLDADDNCASIANVDQHDEDGDDVGDACDNCVGIANEDQLDLGEEQTAGGGGADGIGDACDPNPGTEDNVALVVTFAGADENNQWEIATAQIGWKFDGESAIYEGTVVGEQAVVRSLRTQPTRPFVIEYQVTINGMFQSADGYIGMRADTRYDEQPDAAPSRFGVECGVLHLLNPSPIAISSAGHRENPSEGGNQNPLPIVSNNYRIYMRYDFDDTIDLRCQVAPNLDGEPVQAQIVNVADTAPTGTELALGAVTAPAQIDYFVIYTPR